MNPFDDTTSFEEQFSSLRDVAMESNRRVTDYETDSLFESHSNVFIKAYLVSACSILEAFLQNEALFFVQEVKMRCHTANIPHNLTIWAAGGKADRRFAAFEIQLKERDITENLSGNIDKTIACFEKIGVQLNADDEFRRMKDFVAARVNKRNAIIHENDDASDVSFSDIIECIDQFKKYANCVRRIVRNSVHLGIFS